MKDIVVLHSTYNEKEYLNIPESFIKENLACSLGEHILNNLNEIPVEYTKESRTDQPFLGQVTIHKLSVCLIGKDRLNELLEKEKQLDMIDTMKGVKRWPTL